jgi:hypothetical protein
MYCNDRALGQHCNVCQYRAKHVGFLKCVCMLYFYDMLYTVWHNTLNWCGVDKLIVIHFPSI